MATPGTPDLQAENTTLKAENTTLKAALKAVLAKVAALEENTSSSRKRKRCPDVVSNDN